MKKQRYCFMVISCFFCHVAASSIEQLSLFCLYETLILIKFKFN